MKTFFLDTEYKGFYDPHSREARAYPYLVAGEEASKTRNLHLEAVGKLLMSKGLTETPSAGLADLIVTFDPLEVGKCSAGYLLVYEGEKPHQTRFPVQSFKSSAPETFDGVFQKLCPAAV